MQYLVLVYYLIILCQLSIIQLTTVYCTISVFLGDNILATRGDSFHLSEVHQLVDQQGLRLTLFTTKLVLG